MHCAPKQGTGGPGQNTCYLHQGLPVRPGVPASIGSGTPPVGSDRRGRQTHRRFGDGSIGHLRLLASLGAHVTGIDPDGYLDALCSESLGPGRRATRARQRGGAHRAPSRWHGYWPKGCAGREARWARGFRCVHFREHAQEGLCQARHRQNRQAPAEYGLGVPTDAAIVRTVFSALNPGGLFLLTAEPTNFEKGSFPARQPLPFTTKRRQAVSNLINRERWQIQSLGDAKVV